MRDLHFGYDTIEPLPPLRSFELRRKHVGDRIWFGSEVWTLVSMPTKEHPTIYLVNDAGVGGKTYIKRGCHHP